MGTIVLTYKFVSVLTAVMQLLSLLALGLVYQVSSQVLDCGLPPICFPGQIINTGSANRIFDALKSVLRQGGQMKKCAIGIGNVKGGALINARWFNAAGMIAASPPQPLSQRKSALLLFQKTSFSLYGTSGIIAYDIDKTDKMLAVSWNIPYTSSTGHYNVKIYSSDIELNDELFTQMQDKAGAWVGESFDTNSTKVEEVMMDRSEYGIAVRAHMTRGSRAILTVTVDSSKYDSRLPPARYLKCEKMNPFTSSVCRMECP